MRLKKHRLSTKLPQRSGVSPEASATAPWPRIHMLFSHCTINWKNSKRRLEQEEMPVLRNIGVG
jgi:hypothetical protein